VPEAGDIGVVAVVAVAVAVAGGAAAKRKERGVSTFSRAGAGGATPCARWDRSGRPARAARRVSESE